jgi:anti-sigma factor RsiW
MTKLNLTECCMLDVSGELGDEASARLHRYLSMHPRAQREYDALKSQFDRVRSIPHVELSAAERVAVSSRIKGAVRAKLLAHEKAQAAQRRWKIATYLIKATSVAAAGVVVIGALVAIEQSAKQRKQIERMAKIDRATETLAAYSDTTNSDEQQITNLQDSVARLQTESASTVADIDNHEMASVLNVLAVIPADDPDTDTQ